MMAGARRELMRSDRTADSTGRACDDRGSFVIRLEGIHFRTRSGRARRPFGFERNLVAGGIEFGQETPVVFDRLLDEIPCGGRKHRAALFAIGIQQVRAGPALQRRGQFPAEIGGVFEAGIDAVAAVGRMVWWGTPGEEETPPG